MNKKIWCFFGVHEYTTKASGPIVNSSKTTVGHYYHLQCSVCGKIKVRNLF